MQNKFLIQLCSFIFSLTCPPSSIMGVGSNLFVHLGEKVAHNSPPKI